MDHLQRVRFPRAATRGALVNNDPDGKRIDDEAVATVDFSEAEVSRPQGFDPEIVPGRICLEDSIADDLEAIITTVAPGLIGIDLIQLDQDCVAISDMDCPAVGAVVDGKDL